MIWNLPNLLTWGRILAIPLIVLLFLIGAREYLDMWTLADFSDDERVVLAHAAVIGERVHRFEHTRAREESAENGQAER